MRISLAPRALNQFVTLSPRVRRKSAQPVALIGLLAALVVSSDAIAAPTVYTDQVSWINAVTAINAPAVFGVEDWNGEALTPGNGLNAGPHVYGGGDFSMTLNDVGNGGSQSYIINPGEHDGSNALEMTINHDTSDFVCCGGLTIPGEGSTSIDGVFASSVLGFGADFYSSTTHDGVSVVVNGVTFNLHDYYPDDPMIDGADSWASSTRPASAPGRSFRTPRTSVATAKSSRWTISAGRTLVSRNRLRWPCWAWDWPGLASLVAGDFSSRASWRGYACVVG